MRPSHCYGYSCNLLLLSSTGAAAGVQPSVFWKLRPDMFHNHYMKSGIIIGTHRRDNSKERNSEIKVVIFKLALRRQCADLYVAKKYLNGAKKYCMCLIVVKISKYADR